MDEMQIAITVDDIPSNGPTCGVYTRFVIAKLLIDTLKRNKISQAFGFVNGDFINENQNIIKLWIDSGYSVGNHTYSHPDLRQISVATYLNEIERNEEILGSYSSNTETKMFRHPYLLAGETKEKYYTIKNFLEDRDYIVAPVTIDFLDFLWNEPICKSIENQDNHSVNKLKSLYVNTAVQKATAAQLIARKMFDRDIKQILIIHMGIATALFFDDVIKAFIRLGCNFISLNEALTDPIYKNTPDVISQTGLNFLQKFSRINGFDLSKYPMVPKEKIKEVCKLSLPTFNQFIFA